MRPYRCKNNQGVHPSNLFRNLPLDRTIYCAKKDVRTLCAHSTKTCARPRKCACRAQGAQLILSSIRIFLYIKKRDKETSYCCSTISLLWYNIRFHVSNVICIGGKCVMKYCAKCEFLAIHIVMVFIAFLVIFSWLQKLIVI